MNKDSVIKVSFLIGFVLTTVGAILKILHESSATAFLTVGIVASVLYIALAIYEINTSARIRSSEKLMWIFAFIFMSGLAGLIYFFVSRKRIIHKQV